MIDPKDPKDPADMSQEEHDYWEEQCLMLETMDCPISGMTKEKSIEISRSMAESLKNTDYTDMKLIEA